MRINGGVTVGYDCVWTSGYSGDILFVDSPKTWTWTDGVLTSIA